MWNDWAKHLMNELDRFENDNNIMEWVSHPLKLLLFHFLEEKLSACLTYVGIRCEPAIEVDACRVYWNEDESYFYIRRYNRHIISVSVYDPDCLELLTKTCQNPPPESWVSVVSGDAREAKAREWLQR